MQERSARFRNLLNAARTISILTPEQNRTRPFTSLATVDLKTFNGKTAPAGQMFTVALNPRTGEFDTVVGTTVDRSGGGRGGGEAELKASDIRQFTDNLREQALVRVFFDEVKQGFEREFNEKIATASDLIQALESPFGGLDVKKAMTYLSPEDQAVFGRMVSQGVDSFINGERNPERILNALLKERLATEPGTLGGNKVSVPGLNPNLIE